MKNEKVLSVELTRLRQSFDLSRQYWPIDVAVLNRLSYAYVDRSQAEADFSCKQLIPYALIFDQNGRICTYQRHGSELRLIGKLSAGIGGHVNDRDQGPTLYDRLLSGLRREMREEIGLSFSPSQITVLGMINEDESAVGRCHLGIVFKVHLDVCQKLSFSREIANPEWQRMEQLPLEHFELWSELAIHLAKQGGSV